MRAAKAARVMRQFDALEKIIKKADDRGLTFDSADDQVLWSTWQHEIATVKAQVTRLREPDIAAMFDRVANEDVSLDTMTIEYPTYAGLSAIQYAACTGDVQMLERIVALGAALDYDYVPPNPRRVNRDTVAKPPGCTALLLAVVAAISGRRMLQFGEADWTWRPVYEGAVECAVQLVRLGSDVTVRFELPAGRDARSDVYRMFKLENLIGKTIRELAPLAGSELLVQTIEQFADKGTKIRLANCRCGSRLPWKQCHAAKDTDSYCREESDGSISWRFSPTAPCNCKNTNKIHFKCCWEEQAFREYFQDDKSCEISVQMTKKVSGAQREMLQMMQKNGVDMKKALSEFQHSDESEISKRKLDAIRGGGLPFIFEMSGYSHPKSRVCQYDPEVYAGTMEMMEPALMFDWIDVHWTIPKPELLKRVDEWNEALEKYCDSVGLAGSQREAVVELHRASPFAPCANVKCDRVETKAKQFDRCSR